MDAFIHSRCVYIFETFICLQLVNAYLFHTPELSAIADDLRVSAAQTKDAVFVHVRRMIPRLMLIKKRLTSYDKLAETLTSTKPECVTDKIRNLSSVAIARFNECFPNEAAITAQTQQGQKELDAVIENLAAVDQQLVTVTDSVLKDQMIAQVDQSIVAGFYLEVNRKIFYGIAPVQKCIADAAENLRNTALTNIQNMATCYAPN